MKTIDYIFTIVLLLLGVAHIILTPMFYEQFDIASLWFAETGLGFVFLGFVNLGRLRSEHECPENFSLFCNLLGLVYTILIVTKLSEPQAYISLVVILVLLGFSVRRVFTR